MVGMFVCRHTRLQLTRTNVEPKGRRRRATVARPSADWKLVCVTGNETSEGRVSTATTRLAPLSSICSRSVGPLAYT